MSPRSLVACGALHLVALAHAHLPLSPDAAVAADALSEIASSDLLRWMQPTTIHRVDESSPAAAHHDPAVRFGPPSHHDPASAHHDPAVRFGPPSHTTNAELAYVATMRRQLRTNIAQNSDLVERLFCRRMQQSWAWAGEADAVVCALSRAVYNVVGPVGRSLNEKRPDALAALHRWNALGPVAGQSGHLVAASDLYFGLALLLGPPNKIAVDGAAACAFRALEHISDTVVGPATAAAATAPPVGLEVHRWLRLQRTAATARAKLAQSATSCQPLLGGSYVAAHATASSMELSVCEFVVRAYTALRALQELHVYGADVNDINRFLAFRTYVTAELVKMGNIVVGPVLGGPPLRGERDRAITSVAGPAKLATPVAAVFNLIVIAYQARNAAVYETRFLSDARVDIVVDDATTTLDEEDRQTRDEPHKGMRLFASASGVAPHTFN